MRSRPNFGPWFLLLFVGTASLTYGGPMKPPLQPIKPLVKPTSEEDVARLRAVILEGERQRQEAMRQSPTGAQVLAGLKQAKGKYLPAFRRFEVGEVGLLVPLHRPWGGPSGNFWGRVVVVQVIDEKTMLVTVSLDVAGVPRRDDKFYWVEGFPTTGLADDDTIRGFAALLEIKGTKQYTTALGSTKTVLMLEPFPFDPTPQGRADSAKKAKPRNIPAVNPK